MINRPPSTFRHWRYRIKKAIKRPSCWLRGHRWTDEGDGRQTTTGMVYAPELQRWSCDTCNRWFRGASPPHWRTQHRLESMRAFIETDAHLRMPLHDIEERFAIKYVPDPCDRQRCRY